jgi:predicted enzyme related to lactoylglutathione lyase
MEGDAVSGGLPDLLVNIDVPDLDRATDFYMALLGVRVGRRFAGAAVELVGAAAPIYLLANAADTAAGGTTGERRRYTRHWTPVHLDFAVADLDQAIAQALAAGATLDGPARTRPWGRIAVLADPFGNGFCLIQFLGRGYDEVAT